MIIITAILAAVVVSIIYFRFYRMCEDISVIRELLENGEGTWVKQKKTQGTTQ